jgi:glycerophosphoryl diester phosphodiesterase
MKGIAFLLALSFISFSGIYSENYVDIDNTLRNSDEIIAIAHRGEAKFAPEDTLAAFELAIDEGAKSIEMDVRMTADEHLVLMHDDDVSRTTDGEGRISEMTLEEIKALRIKPEPWMTVHEPQEVPTLEEALLFIKGRAIADLDVKSADPALLVRTIESADALNTAYVDVSSVEEALLLREINPWIAIQAGDIESTDEAAQYIDALGRVEVFELEEIHQGVKETIDFCHKHGSKVHIPEKETLYLLGWPLALSLGVDGIQTDNLQMLMPYLERINSGARVEEVF